MASDQRAPRGTKATGKEVAWALAKRSLLLHQYVQTETAKKKREMYHWSGSVQ